MANGSILSATQVRVWCFVSASDFLALGLMSGTSADGIDAALIRTDGEHSIQSVGGTTIPYSRDLHNELIAAAQLTKPIEVAKEETKDLERRLTNLHDQAVRRVCALAQISVQEVDVIGFHGHTLRHLPKSGLTWQIGDGRELAAATGCTVVFDFRQADVEAGGEGAPLAPLFHQALLAHRNGAQLVLNLGGVGNITWLGERDEIAAGDTGPGCGLLDAWIQRKTGRSFDRNGATAMQGHVDEQLTAKALELHPYFRRPLPKSADRFEFDEIDVSHLSVEDGAATLCAITTDAVVQCVERLGQLPRECWVTGGGRHHPVMMKRLVSRLPNVRPFGDLGFDEDLIEAQCFAWLAVRRLKHLPTSLPATTGVRHPVSGGVIVEPPRLSNR